MCFDYVSKFSHCFLANFLENVALAEVELANVTGRPLGDDIFAVTSQLDSFVSSCLPCLAAYSMDVRVAVAIHRKCSMAHELEHCIH